MIIGVISDTHENVANILKAVEEFKKENVEFVIHLGDVIAPGTVKFFEGLNMKFIQGNCDGDIDLLKQKIEEKGWEFLGETAELELNGKKIFLSHKPNEEAINSGKYAYVFHGHTHKKRLETVGNTTVLNPGAHYWKSENTIVVLDLEKDEARFLELS